jgi:hypothetical protein
MSTIKQRLSAYLSTKKISKKMFGEKIGVSSAYVTSIRKSIQPDKLELIAANFPDLNISWLLTGEGDMIRIIAAESEQVDVMDDMVAEGDVEVSEGAHQGLVLDDKLVHEIVAEVSAWRGMIQKQFDCSQTTIDRLLTILENTSKH